MDVHVHCTQNVGRCCEKKKMLSLTFLCRPSSPELSVGLFLMPLWLHGRGGGGVGVRAMC